MTASSSHNESTNKFAPESTPCACWWHSRLNTKATSKKSAGCLPSYPSAALPYFADKIATCCDKFLLSRRRTTSIQPSLDLRLQRPAPQVFHECNKHVQHELPFTTIILLVSLRGGETARKSPVCCKVSSQPGKWLTFYQVAAWSNSSTFGVVGRTRTSA